MVERIKAPDAKNPSKPRRPQPKQLRNQKGFSGRTKLLTTQQRRFVDNYVRTGIVGQSAIDAGYNTPIMGSQLLRVPKIQAEIERKKALMNKTADDVFSVEAKAVLRELAMVAFSSTRDYYKNWGQRQRTITIPSRTKGQPDRTVVLDEVFAEPYNKAELTEQQQRCVGEVQQEVDPKSGKSRLRIRTYDKMKALHLLGSYFGLFDGSGKKFDPNDVVKDLRDAAMTAEQMFPGVQTPTVDQLALADADDTDEE